MKSAINELDQQLWDCCVCQRAAENMEMAEKWQKDPFLYQQEGYVIVPMPSSMQQLVAQAIAEWKGIEEKVCADLRMSRDQFLREFEIARVNFQSGGSEWKDFAVTAPTFMAP